jgi:hypothetical protein
MLRPPWPVAPRVRGDDDKGGMQDRSAACGRRAGIRRNVGIREQKRVQLD